MSKRWGIVLVLLVGLLASLLLLLPSVSFFDVIVHPWESLRGSNADLQIRLLEVSEGFQPAGRRLLKPFGDVHLLQTMPARTYSQDKESTQKSK